jgi:hypothetical protein
MYSINILAICKRKDLITRNFCQKKVKQVLQQCIPGERSTVENGWVIEKFNDFDIQ